MKKRAIIATETTHNASFVAIYRLLLSGAYAPSPSPSHLFRTTQRIVSRIIEILRKFVKSRKIIVNSYDKRICTHFFQQTEREAQSSCRRRKEISAHREEKNTGVPVGTGGNKYLRTTYAAKVRNNLIRHMGSKFLVDFVFSLCECPM